MHFLIVELVVLVALILLTYFWGRSYSDAKWVVAFLSGIAAFSIAVVLAFQLFGLWYGPYSDRQFIAEVEAVRATSRGQDYDSATWRLKVADINARIATTKFDQQNFPAWHAPEIQSLKPIKTEN